MAGKPCMAFYIYIHIFLILKYIDKIHNMLTYMNKDQNVLMQLRLGVLTGEHANYSQIVTDRHFSLNL